MIKIIGMLFIFLCSQVNASTIEDYSRIFTPVMTAEGELHVAIRVFKKNGVPSFLIVNPENLQTRVMPVNQLEPRDASQTEKPGYFNDWKIASTHYYQLLNKATAAPYVLENQGITHGNNQEPDQILTVDLCPSIKPLEQKFFNELVNISTTAHRPTPVTIFITGLWLIDHPKEFQWLLTQKKNKTLDITWGNHSFNHAYYHDLPYSKNFLLIAGTNPELEILLTEQYLLEADQVPSVFFRFPGLVSNESWIKTMKNYGLIPIGADAWLAKDQPVTAGGIILVHGNGNEPAGIAAIFKIFNQLNFVDIKQAL